MCDCCVLSRAIAQCGRPLPNDAADFTSTITIRDDRLETQAEIDTYRGWIEHPSDAFLRAYIDKKSGLVRYQLYATVTYFGDWRFYDRINYRDENDAVQEGQLTRIGNDANCSALAYSNRCELTEDVGFDLSSIIVERLASVYRPGGTPVSWQFKLKSHYQDTDIVNGIVPAEAAALVSAVSAYKAKLAER